MDVLCAYCGKPLVRQPGRNKSVRFFCNSTEQGLFRHEHQELYPQPKKTRLKPALKFNGKVYE